MQWEREGEEIMKESRVKHLEFCLSTLGFNKALKAMDFVIKEMCAEKNFKRHDGSHYYYHLIDATQDLFNHGIKDEDILTACLLHDAVEDIDWVSIEDIESEYGSNVATMVNLVTKEKDINYRKPLNIQIYLDKISQNVGASLIKTADRKHNFSTLRDASRAKKIRQADETQVFFIPFFKVCRKLYPRYASYFYSAKTTIEPHLWEIQERYREVERLEKALEPSELNDHDVLCEPDLNSLNEAFKIIDRAVDRQTTSHALAHIWYLMSELVEHNEVSQ